MPPQWAVQIILDRGALPAPKAIGSVKTQEALREMVSVQKMPEFLQVLQSPH